MPPGLQLSPPKSRPALLLAYFKCRANSVISPTLRAMLEEWLSIDRERCNLLRGITFCNFRFAGKRERERELCLIAVAKV